MDKTNYFTDNDDLLFLLNNRCDFDEIYKWISPAAKDVSGANSGAEYKQTWLTALETIGEVCGNQIGPNAQAIDSTHCVLKPNGEVELPPQMTENLNTLNQVGCASLGVGAEHGGLEAPFLVEMVCAELINRGCPSTLLNAAWYGTISQIIEKFGSQELQNEYCGKIASGEWSGSMALTEPDAGSDLAAISSYGEIQPDGSYKIFGSKRFISNGNSQVCLILARSSKKAVGLRSINLYLCPRKYKEKQNYKISKLEEKLALHGSATCELQLDGSVAFLVGKEGEGFQYMLHLMNDARLSVGAQALGLMEASFRIAKKYAQERVTWGKPIAHHELIAEKLLDLEVELKAYRSLVIQASHHMSVIKAASKFLEKNKEISPALSDEAKHIIKKYQKRVRSWTPVIKWWAGERAYEHARTCLQIHGGYGFSTEYRPEFWLRESIILSLYEGTSQIQALMCVKDTFKEVIRQPKGFMEHFLGVKVKQISKESAIKKKLYKAKEIYDGAIFSVLMQLLRVNLKISMSSFERVNPTRLLKDLAKVLGNFENLRPAFLHAERICEMKAVIAQAEAVVRDAELYPERLYLAERFLNRYIPKLGYLKAQIEEDCQVLQARLEADSLTAAKIKGDKQGGMEDTVA